MNPRKRNADTQEAAWIADEDAFVLRQAYNKAHIRVKEGRAKPIDRLAVTLHFVDDTRNPLDNDLTQVEPELVEPEAVIEALDDDQMKEMVKDMNVYMSLEGVEKITLKREFWRAAYSVCKDRLQELAGTGTEARGARSVSADVSKVFQSKTYDELLALEKQIDSKLRSDQPIDIDYWQELLTRVTLFKSRAKLRLVTDQAMSLQIRRMRDKQAESARLARRKLELAPSAMVFDHNTTISQNERVVLDPESLLKVPKSCKGVPIVEEHAWLGQVVCSTLLNTSPLSPAANPYSPSSVTSSSNTVTLLARTLHDLIHPEAACMNLRHIRRACKIYRLLFTHLLSCLSNKLRKGLRRARRHSPKKQIYQGRHTVRILTLIVIASLATLTVSLWAMNGISIIRHTTTRIIRHRKSCKDINSTYSTLICSTRAKVLHSR